MSTGQHSAARSESLTAVDVLPILLVDDRVANLRALEAVLESLGHPLLSATSGAEALRLLLEHEVALILLDVRMPQLSGLETAQLIKGRERTREVPIVFMTASPDELENVLRGYDVGALDYLLKPVDPDLLRTKVAVFVELEASRRALLHSEALLRGAFEAAPIGKTVLDSRGRIIRANPAFARLLGRAEVTELQGMTVTELAHGDDREELLALLARLAGDDGGPASSADDAPISADVILQTLSGREILVEAVASTISPSDHGEPSLLIQWVDLTTRRRAEEARAELLLEQAARSQAERDADRLRTLQTISDALDSASLGDLLAELVHRLCELFAAEAAEVQIAGEMDQPMVVRVIGGRVERLGPRLAGAGRSGLGGGEAGHSPHPPRGPAAGALAGAPAEPVRGVAAERGRRTRRAGHPPRPASRAGAPHRRGAPARIASQAAAGGVRRRAGGPLPGGGPGGRGGRRLV